MDLINIKFRAKRKDTLTWVYGIPAPGKAYPGAVCILTFEPCKDLPKNAVFLGCGFIPVLSNTICQYTGMKDMYGAEIWEHDLLKFEKTSDMYEVVYVNGTFVFLNISNKFQQQGLPCYKKVDYNIIRDMFVVRSIFDGDSILDIQKHRRITSAPHNFIAD